MAAFKYPHLFEPIRLGGTLFRNRIFAAPTGYRNMTYDSVLPIQAADYYARKAMGGAASVSSGELIVDTELGRGTSNHICIDNPQSHMPLSRVANEISRYGAVAAAELQHAGMYANRNLAFFGGASNGIAFGPTEMELDGRMIQPMTEEIIERTIAKYAEAAAAAKSSGFGMILIHAGHGWLLQQFLSPRLNTRKDRWGGPDIENRSRLTLAICQAVRKAVGPGFPIEIRISGSECYEGGYDIEEGIAFAKQLEGYVDLIHVSVGNHEIKEVFSVTHPSMFLGDGCNVSYAAAIKKEVKTPVAAIGALGEPELLEEIIASGQADVVEMARSLIADPDLPNKIRSGRESEVRHCMRCLYCFSSQLKYGVKYCAINPESGREHESVFEPRLAKVSKKVLVIGGGIGGMQAALTCSERGHKVILCEKNAELGGAVLCERNVLFKRKLNLYKNTQAEALKKSNIDLRTNRTVTPDYAQAVGADVIIAAVGSIPIKPQIPGIDGSTVLSAEDAYLSPDRVGEKAVIIGAGLVGLELALFLASLSKSAVVVEMTDSIKDGGNMLHTESLLLELKKSSIDVRLNTRALQVTEQGLLCSAGNGSELLKADTVIYAVGQKPLQEEALAFKFCAPEFYMLGDCVTPENIYQATSTAYHIAKTIGRY